MTRRKPKLPKKELTPKQRQNYLARLGREIVTEFSIRLFVSESAGMGLQ